MLKSLIIIDKIKTFYAQKRFGPAHRQMPPLIAHAQHFNAFILYVCEQQGL